MQPSLFPMGDTPTVIDHAPARPLSGARLKEDLNPAQYEAVTCKEGPVLVIAGAGSGKTRTLVYRLAHLVEEGVAPESILLLTFTRKAAQEMIHRGSQIMDSSCQRVTGGTFHAVANLLLRRHGRHLGYGANFTILDRSDSEGIINLLKSSLNLGEAGKRFPSKRVIINAISRAVNKSLTLLDVLHEQYEHFMPFWDDILVISEHYRKFKLEHGLMDYDDLLVNWKRVLAEVPAVRDEISERFQYLMVDEYQDTNLIQAEIVRLIASRHNNVMVVGDDSQSIYSFRGANFRNIMEFPQTFPGTRIIRLEENYRSTQNILAVTNAIIEHAVEKYTKKLYSQIEGGAKPVIYAARNETGQAQFVAEKIAALVAEGTPLREIAVLFRSGFHSYKLELELANRQLVFEKRGGLKLTESAHIKDFLAYLRVVCNPSDHLAWNRILLLVDKVGPKTAQKMLGELKGAPDPFQFLARYPAGKSWQASLQQLVAVLTALKQTGLSLTAQYDLVMDYYREIFERVFHDDYPTRRRDLDQLKVILATYESLDAFVADTALDPPENATEQSAAAGAGERLILSTVHSAKGLEWDVVFIINLAEGKFPSTQSSEPGEREEERRLFYVAATRARKQLFMTYPREVLSPEQFRTVGEISSFLDELPRGLTQTLDSRLPELTPAFSRAKQTVRAAVFAPDALQPGVRVRHAFFGEGKIEAVSGPRTVVVYFGRHGQKTLHLDYAKLEIVG